MKRIEIFKTDITVLSTDVIVNAANSSLRAGGGVCGAIFRAAGCNELQNACDRIGHCDEGNAAITDGFNLQLRHKLNQDGKKYSDENILGLLEFRAISKKIRSSGGKLKGHPKRTSQQNKDFENSLIKLLEERKD